MDLYFSLKGKTFHLDLVFFSGKLVSTRSSGFYHVEGVDLVLMSKLNVSWTSLHASTDYTCIRKKTKMIKRN